MKVLGIVLLLAISFFSVAKQGLLVKNVTLISPELAMAQENRNVLIIDDRIIDNNVQVVKGDEYRQVIDGSGQFLVPGIMDSHVHVSSIPGMGFGGEKHVVENTELAMQYFTQQPKSFLYYGVTHVVDPNPGKHWSEFVSGEIHPDYFRCEVVTSKETFPYIEKTSDIADKIFSYLVQENTAIDDKNSPESLITKIAESGAVCIKLYFENGYGDSDQWPLLSPATLKRIKAAAVKNNLMILAHANAVDMYQAALDAKADVLAHGLWNWGKYSRNQYLPNEMLMLLNEVNSKGIGFMATQRVISGLGEVMLPETKDNSAFLRTTPKALLNWYRTPAAQWFNKELIAGFDGLSSEKIAEIFLYGRTRKNQQVITYLDSVHHPMLIASDFPGSPSYANQPGLTTYQEMQMLAQAGISLKGVLAAATINNAKQFNLADDYGSVENGKVANLLLLNENPLKTIEAWDAIDKIILRGKVHARDDLRANKPVH